jgi:Bardet-Biedl syndrome 7 protein
MDSASNEAILSRTPCDPRTGNAVLAVYRLEEGEKRLEIKMRTVEGQYGDINLLVVGTPGKDLPMTAQAIKFVAKPLSLHHRLNDPPPQDRAMNNIRFTGPFSLNLMHEWVQMCLPNIPQRIQHDTVLLHFRNSFLGSLLSCDYRKGEASFSSDSLSTIGILREVITKEATTRKIRIDIAFDVNNDTVPAFLGLVRPKLE